MSCIQNVCRVGVYTIAVRGFIVWLDNFVVVYVVSSAVFSCSEEADATDISTRNCGAQIPDSHADFQRVTEGKGHCWAL